MAIRYSNSQDTLADPVHVVPVPWNNTASRYQTSDLIDIEYLAAKFSHDQTVAKGCGYAE